MATPQNTKRIIGISVAVLIVIVAIIGVIYVNQDKRGQKQTNQNTNKTTNTKTAEKDPFAYWIKFNSPDKQFSVLFPNYPKQDTQTLTVPNSTTQVTYNAYVSTSADGTTYQVSTAEYPSTVDVSRPESNLNGVVNGILNSFQGATLDSSKITVAHGFPAIDFAITTPEFAFQGQAILKEHKLYQIIVIRNLGVDKEKEYAGFLDSFTLTPAQ